jgi:hypothetical protein
VSGTASSLAMLDSVSCLGGAAAWLVAAMSAEFRLSRRMLANRFMV